jgi:hypothetical protein
MALTPWQSVNPPVRDTIPGELLVMKGQGTDNLYVVEVDQTTGAIPVEGAGTPGTPTGGVQSIQGVVGGTPVAVTGTFTNPAVGPTGSPVPADADYAGMNVGGNLVGLVGTVNGLKVDGSAVTQPVSASSLPLPTGAATNAELVTINTTLGSPLQAGGTVSVSNFPATQPVSGTVAVSNFPATQPVSGTVAATQSGTWTVQPGNTANTTPWLASISQGGNTATVSAANALKVDGSAVTQPVSGTITANAGTGNFTVTQATGTNLHVVVDSAPTTAVTGTFWQATQPVSGTFFQATQPVSIAATVTTSDLADGSASGGTAGTKSMLGGGIYNSSSPTLTTGQQASLQLNASGALITSSGAPTTSAVTFQDGSLGFVSLTTSFVTVLATGGVLKHVDMRNNTNAVIIVTLNGSTNSYTLDPGDYVSLDLAENGANIPSSTNLQAKYSGTAPTSGSIRINGFY